jgi:hypothetical protein
MKLYACLILFVIVGIGLLTSCKKGDTGPQGEPGTANVIYSPWFTPNAYKKDTIFGNWGFSYNQAAPQITQQMIDSGAVFTFAKLLGYNPAIWPASQVSLMPISITFSSGGLMTDTWSAYASPGNLKIRMINDHNYWSSIATTHQFRYIIVPGGQKTGRSAPLSYSELCLKYNIPE